MASSYPPPPSPPASTSSAPAPVPASQTNNETSSSAVAPGSPQLHPVYGSTNSDNDAIATAHHGLQALQAATAESAAQVGSDDGGAGQALHYVPSQAASYNVVSPSTTLAQAQAKDKLTRLRRACDMCSQRKVKCTEVQPCQPCRDLNVECTFHRAMKRRGPPNRHAEAARAAKLPRLEPHTNVGHANSGPQQTAARALVSIATQGPPDGESIAPWPSLMLLIDDFFNYIHPLVPFPHEPTFRESLNRREDRSNPEFLALLASMVGCLAASFPRTVRSHLKVQQSLGLFPKSITMIERCRSVALEARGPKFYEKENVSVHDAATSYFLGLAAGYTMQHNLCRRFMSESMTFLRELGYHTRRKEVYAVTYRGPPFDYIQDEIGKRIFWVLFLGVRSVGQSGAPPWDLQFPLDTAMEPYPDLPLMVDDQYIACDHIREQPENMPSTIRGFIEVIRIYRCMDEVVRLDVASGPDSIPIAFELQDSGMVKALQKGLEAVKNATENLPYELKLNSSQGGHPNMMDNQPDYYDSYQYYPPAFPNEQPQTDIRHVIENQPERKRSLKCEIQKANIYLSALATRSYFVERYHSLRDSHLTRVRSAAASAFPMDNGDGTGDGFDNASKLVAAQAIQAVTAADQADQYDENMAVERHLIISDLVTVLSSINQLHMEPNGQSIINKIRQIASTLLDQGAMRGGGDPSRPRDDATEYLNHFLKILSSLEKTTGFRPDQYSVSAHDEEQELRSWAELRDYQSRVLHGQPGPLYQV